MVRTEIRFMYGKRPKQYQWLIPVLLLLLLPACLSWFLEKPTFTLKDVAVSRISLTDIDFLFGIEVQNPNSFDLTLRALEYTIFFNDREVGIGRLDKEIRMAKASSTLVQIPFRADFRSLGDPVRLVLAGKALNYHIQGSAVLSAFLGSKTVPFSKAGEIKFGK